MLITEKYLLLMYIVRQSPTKAPYYYSQSEGGIWKRWPEDKHFYYLPWLSMRHPRFVNMAGLQVHALAFGEISSGWSGYQRWDCINGFDHLVIEPCW